MSDSIYVNQHNRPACVECHRYDCCSDVIPHARNCSLKNAAKNAAVSARIAATVERIKATATNGGDDKSTLEAFKQGKITMSEAMNLDD